MPSSVAFQRVKSNGFSFLSFSLTLQSFEKLLLTEGEKMFMVICQIPLETQGIYALVQNLGSLIARFVFQPVEEACFNAFSFLSTQQQQLLMLLMQ